MATGDEGRKVVLIAVDESKESMYSLEWSLNHLFTAPSAFKVVLVHAKPLPVSVLKLTGPGVADVISIVEKDIKKTAASVIEKAQDLCAQNSITDYEVVVAEGDARNVLCDAVDKYHADILVVGSHGYGAIKRAILGSVSDYCAHHAHCSVLIVKKPKAKADH